MQWSTTFWFPHHKIILGDNVGIGARCVVNTDLTIGNDVLIASHVAFVAPDAHLYDVVGTSMFQSPRGDHYEIVIEDDVWIGFGAIILSGVRVGRGSGLLPQALLLLKIYLPTAYLCRPADTCTEAGFPRSKSSSTRPGCSIPG